MDDIYCEQTSSAMGESDKIMGANFILLGIRSIKPEKLNKIRHNLKIELHYAAEHER